MIFKRIATGVDNRYLKCISFALKIQGIIFFLKLLCFHFQLRILTEKKNWFREKNES